MIKVNGIEIHDIGELARFEGLTHLDLSNSGIFDIGVLTLHTDLISLNLSNNEIFDIGPLTLLTKLKDLDLRGNPISAAQIEQLKKLLPNTDIASDY